MARQLSNHAAAAAAIRAELKRHGIKASVTSESFSMGDAVRVRIRQDLSPAALREVQAFARQYQYGHFDGMTDSYEHSNHRADLPQSKFVSVEIEYSPEIKAAAAAYIAGISGIEPYERDRYEWMALSGAWGNFWRDRKPRVRLGGVA